MEQNREVWINTYKFEINSWKLSIWEEGKYQQLKRLPGKFGSFIYKFFDNEDFISISLTKSGQSISVFFSKELADKEDFWNSQKVYWRKWINLKDILYFDFAEEERVVKVDGNWQKLN